MFFCPSPLMDTCTSQPKIRAALLRCVASPFFSAKILTNKIFNLEDKCKRATDSQCQEYYKMPRKLYGVFEEGGVSHRLLSKFSFPLPLLMTFLHLWSFKTTFGYVSPADP